MRTSAGAAAAAQVPLDGVIVWGEADVSAEAITGEALPQRRARGAELPAGARALDGILAVRATRPASQSTLARIAQLTRQARVRASPPFRHAPPHNTGACSPGGTALKADKACDCCAACAPPPPCAASQHRGRLAGRHIAPGSGTKHAGSVVGHAQANRPRVQSWLDGFGRRYSRGVVAATALALLALPALGVPLLGSAGERGALYRAMGLLTAASPCAIVLVPLAYVSAVAAVTRR